MNEVTQPPPPVCNPAIDHREIGFPHPSEKEFARILDYYGIAWEYEPYTYTLRWDKDGHVLEAFSPDFYLVDQDLYIELTTLRQKLIRIKRRKIRRLRALYPDVHVRLWTRRDFAKLLERFGIEARSENLIGQQALES